MGLFDEVLGAVSGSAAAGTHSGIVATLTELLNSSQTGGVAGVIQSFEQAGLGNIVQSWVSTGQNLPVTADQITQALSSGQLSGVASKLGLQNPAVASLIAQLLPQMIDHLTPNGTVPQHNDLVGSLAGFAQSFLKS